MFITSEGEVDKFPSPEELWIKTFKDKNEWSSKFDTINFEPFRGTKEPRYYQEIAINNALDAIADKQQRILLTLATGTGKTVIAFHCLEIVSIKMEYSKRWKEFQEYYSWLIEIY